MIRFINAQETLSLRSAVLRVGAPLSDCHFQGDNLETTFHMGYLSGDGDTVCILTCQLEALEGHPGTGYRLRGMATHPDWRGKGIGTELLNAAINHLATGLMADYLWCNARRVAYDFYRQLGFTTLSAEFEIPGIGPHSVMHLALN
ncbi:Acetyltransferase (GNAT) domain-containing protein [Parapedobacter luteus]|uniref:Acetyltransferase (GNAT) domain-containing protein n=1 Tax=Parapedobacter luteus TaxID=623280 RepID=A0A1T5AX74_9SPHI|nr:GNAT family N-acetyltransferase [Parapedobacter luteus]SKB39370.1 Acetyltransferase (GNAT) domain-containing protein [Parapedobacter luteus]